MNSTKPNRLTQRLSYIIPLEKATQHLQLPNLIQASDRPSQSKPFIIKGSSNELPSIQDHSLSHPAHRLGVNALALDLSTQLQSHSSSNGIIYTAGKDGLIAAWELHLPTSKHPNLIHSIPPSPLHSFHPSSVHPNPNDASPPSHPFSEISLNYLPQIPSTSFRQCIQTHTNWCNDIVLCNHNQTLISASSDRTVKAWSPHHPNLSLCPITIGTHNDYVKCLAHSPLSAWVASAGLDRKILLWDITETRPKPLLRFPDNSTSSSIYSLATNPTGQILATGSPAQPIGLYDPRLCSQVAKLVGHTDNVRSILLSDDATRLLSASSDTTVKMWDVRMQRCLHTFSHHSTSVWALHSQHPSLQIFHSGDRSGWLCKVDLEGSDDFGQGECVVLCQAGQRHHHHISTTVNEGIVKIVALDDVFVWTATGSSTVQRWKDIPTRLQRRQDAASLISSDFKADPLSHTSPSIYQEQSSNSLPPNQSLSPSSLRSPQSVSFNLDPTLSPTPSLTSELAPHPTKSLPASIIPLTIHSSSSCFPQFIQLPPDKLDGVPLESLVPLFSPFDHLLHSSDRPDHPEVITIHSLKSSSPSNFSPHTNTNHHFTHLTRHSISPPNLCPPNLGWTIPSTAETQPTPTVRNHPPPSTLRTTAWRLYTTRDSALEAIPLRDAPDDIIPGCSGLVKSELLNDRRHVITLDTRGTLALWDIISCICLGIFDTHDLDLEDSSGSSIGSTASPSSLTANELFKLVKERIEGEASIGTWCTVETQTGLLTVHLDESRCFDAEVYADESGLSPETLSLMKEDHRLSLGKWILRNLFDGFITHQAQLRRQNESIKSSEIQTTHSTGSTAPTKILPQNRAGMASEDQESSSSNDNAEWPPQPNNSTGKVFVPRTPGTTIALATPALTPTMPPEFKLAQSSNDPMKTVQGPDSVCPPAADYFSLERVPESDENLAIPETVVRGPSDSSTDASSSYRSSTNPPSSPALISLDGHPRVVEDKIRSESPGTVHAPTSSTSQQNSASIFTRFKSLGRGQKRRCSQDPPVPTVISNPIPSRGFAHDSTQAELNGQQEAFAERRKLQQHMVQAILSRPFEPIGELDAPKLTSLPEETTILISEEQSETGAWEVCYRGLVGTTYEDADLLLEHSPAWLLDFLLGNRISPAHAAAGLVKVTFVLQPEGGPEAAGLPSLTNANARLTASRALRMKKVASYVIQKLESPASPQSTIKSKQSPQHLKATSMSNAETSNESHASKSKLVERSVSPNGSPTVDNQHNSQESPGGPSLNTMIRQPNSTNKQNESMTSTSSPALISTPTSSKTASMKYGTTPIDESRIIISCNGKILQHTVCLGVVKQYFWNKSEDVVINYRLSDHQI